jgi:ESCRT-II complex subunit VPS22
MARAQQKSQISAREKAVSLMATLMAQLEAFGVSHREEIQRSGRTDPQWRARFLDLFRRVGVDPLSSSKNVWSQALGTDLVKFYADLAIAAAGVCMATRPLNGGLISLAGLTERLNSRKRQRTAPAAAAAGGGGGASGSKGAAGPTASPDAIAEDDVRLALERLKVLGGGFTIVSLGGAPYVRSVDEALASDSTTLLNAAVQARAFATTAALAAGSLAWPVPRAQLALDALAADSMAWLDVHEGVTTYYFPSFLNL